MKFIKLKEVLDDTGLSRSVLYSKLNRGTFPKPIRLTGASGVWLDSDIQGWIKRCIRDREARQHGEITT